LKMVRSCSRRSHAQCFPLASHTTCVTTKPSASASPHPSVHETAPCAGGAVGPRRGGARMGVRGQEAGRWMAESTPARISGVPSGHRRARRRAWVSLQQPGRPPVPTSGCVRGR
jgi:hypothetical protein